MMLGSAMGRFHFRLHDWRKILDAWHPRLRLRDRLRFTLLDDRRRLRCRLNLLHMLDRLGTRRRLEQLALGAEIVRGLLLDRRTGMSRHFGSAHFCCTDCLGNRVRGAHLARRVRSGANFGCRPGQGLLQWLADGDWRR